MSYDCEAPETNNYNSGIMILIYSVLFNKLQ